MSADSRVHSSLHRHDGDDPEIVGRTARFDQSVPDGSFGRRIDGLTELAILGLAQMYNPARKSFPRTVRGRRSPAGPVLTAEGESLRSTAIVTLGLGLLPAADQRRVLAGIDARQLSRSVARRALHSGDLGAVALAAWAAAEVDHHFAEDLFRHIDHRIAGDDPVDVVDCSWALTAALSAADLVNLDDFIRRISKRLMAAQGPAGLFPHQLEGPTPVRRRSRIGSFADQCYPIYALSRLHRLTSHPEPLDLANACADQIVALQGEAGQWWSYYNVRRAIAVKHYPLRGEHGHALAPMALHALTEAGGSDHFPAVSLGLDWLVSHPKATASIIDPPLGLMWRSVVRREPRRLRHAMAAMITRNRPALRIPFRGNFMPLGPIDYARRPQELGWLLYSWSGFSD